ncbi:MAG: hypothetical protein HY079_07475, partial [Elusimicrobia bacterium]|nr:hypothetical protein [Elusimicrobiota bacterium]
MKTILCAALVVLAAASARAEDLSGRLGVGGSVGSSSPIGSKTLTDTRD